jgi:hypothetical protein
MRARAVLAMGLLRVTLGCSKLTLENCNTITAGMRYEGVTQLLGKPDECDDLMGVQLPVGR